MISRNRVTAWIRATVVVLVYAGALTVGPLLILALSHWVTIPQLGWFHYLPGEEAPPFAQQFHGWFLDTYTTIRLDLDDRARGALACIIVLGGSWLGLVWISLSTLWCLTRNGADALREQATKWGPRGWIASLVTTLVLAGTASPASAATTARPVATAPHHPHHIPPHGNRPGAEPPATPGDHTHPPPRTPGVHLPADIRPDCPRYRVHRGDTLTTIAERELGTLARWHDLARVNAFQLGTNPDHLEPGWEILLPPEAAPPKQGPTKIVTVAPGDTLWSISERELGTPNRWGQLWDLNLRRTQPDGLHLSLPDTLRPGWRIVVPDEPHNEPPPGLTPTAPVPSHDPFTIAPWPDPFPPAHESPVTEPRPGPRPGPATRHAAPDTPHRTLPPEHAPPPDQPREDRGRNPRPVDGVEPAPGVFLGLGLAAAISVALGRARVKHRSTYAPAPSVSDYQPAPTVYALRIAHLNATRDLQTGEPLATEHTHPAEADGSALRPTPRCGPPPEASPHLPLPVELGVQNEETVRLDLASCHGVGLSGPTHHDAVRALLLHLLSRHTPRENTPVAVVMTHADAALLLPDVDHPPSTVQLVEDLPEALDRLDACDSATADTDSTQEGGDTQTVLITRSPVEHAHRLHTLLRRRRDLAAVVLGSWPDGLTLTLDHHGLVTHTTPEGSDHLRGTHVFTATPRAGADLLPLTPTPRTPLPPLPPPANPWELTFGHDPRPTSSPAEIEDLFSPPASPHHTDNTVEADSNQARDHGQRTRVHGDTPPPAGTRTPATDATTSTAAAAHDEPTDSQTDSARGPTRHLDARSKESGDAAAAPVTPEPDTAAAGTLPLRLRVFGQFALTWTPPNGDAHDLTPMIGTRQRDMLTYLALHPHGVARESLITDVWGEARRSRPTNAFNTLLYRLREALRTATDNEVSELLDTSNPQRYTLAPTLVGSDYGDLAHVQERLGSDNERTEALRTLVHCYTGDLAPYLDAEWIEAPRYDAHRAYINAVAELSNTHTDQHPRQTLHLLESAAGHDPLNETLYRAIMRLQHRLGLHHAIPATLRSLRTHLHSIDAEPSTDTTHLAHALTHTDS